MHIHFEQSYFYSLLSVKTLNTQLEMKNKMSWSSNNYNIHKPFFLISTFLKNLI